MLTEWQHKAACELLGVEPIVLGEHCPHVNHPDVLADALERIDNL
jgi:LmbE family N-acetylglucosaminyl deacetylase